MRIVALAVILTGCSALSSQRPPKNHADLDYFACEPSKLAPAVDTGIAVSSGLSAIAFLAASTNVEDEATETFAQTSLAVAAISALVYGISASHGYSASADCRAAIDAAGLRATERRLAATAPVTPVAATEIVPLPTETVAPAPETAAP